MSNICWEVCWTSELTAEKILINNRKQGGLEQQESRPVDGKYAKYIALGFLGDLKQGKGHYYKAI